MPNEVANLVLQPSSAVYSLLKDLLLYMKSKAKYVKKLEDNLSMMIAELATFYSKKKQIDQYLETAVSKEKNGEYDILIEQIKAFHKRCSKFVDKYQGSCQDLPSFKAEEDISTAANIIGILQERKPTIKTRKFFQLSELSRKINELLHDISRVTDKMTRDNVLADKKIEAVVMKRGDIDFPSSTRYVDKILNHLNEDGNMSIGILGPIGVGKTTILRKLNDHLKHASFPLSGLEIMKRKFEFVIWIDYPKQRDGRDDITRVIQDVIMGRLKLEREKTNSIDQNASIISTFLWDKKYILLIDQVISAINLNEVGIHKDHKLGKVVIASSSRKVINHMTDEQVEIQPLSEDDALDLFQEVCGLIYDERIKNCARSIIRSCGGLPLVIQLVAYDLRGVENEDVWNKVRRLLQSESKGELQNLAGVGHAYKRAYEKLQNSHKKCLLFVTLFPSDHKIYKDYLVECWNAENFLEIDAPAELRSARESGADTLRKLTDEYLLETLSDNHIKMPKYFRKVVAEQEYPDEDGSVSWIPQRIQPYREETWRTSKRMSLICCKPILPSNPSCGNMSTLLMQCNHDLISLGDGFFLTMQKLCILDLHRTMIKALPSTVSSLVSLRCLYLNDCPLLSELPQEVNMLKKLELLDIRGTPIRSLTNEISDTLRCLRISFGQTGCNQYGKFKQVVMTIPPDLIRNLPQLEELTIEAGCCSKAWNDIVDRIVIDELVCLEKLSTLNFHFPKVSILKEFVGKSRSLNNIHTHWETNTLRSFNISIGCCEMGLPYGSEISRISPERRLTLSSTDGEITSVKEVLRQANSFELVGHCGLRSLSELDLENAGALKVCVVNNCEMIVNLVDETKCGVLKCLEKLHLVNLKAMKTIWKGPILGGSLANLKDLTLFGCSGLTTVLNHELAKALWGLEYVRVEKCDEVVEIISDQIPNEHGISEDVDLSNVLNKVTTIELVNLPMLQGICNTSTTSMNWKSLVRIVVERCRRLGDIHLSLRNAENIKTVECEESWWIGLDLSEEQKQRFLRRGFVVMEREREREREQEQEPAEGNSSTHGTSNGYVSNKCNGDVMPRDGLQDLPESSQRVAEHVTHCANVASASNKGKLKIEDGENK